jgi:hypothetical protein
MFVWISSLRAHHLARLFTLVVVPLACGGEPPEPAEVHFRVAGLDAAPTCGPSLVASGLALAGEREGQGSVLVVAEAPTDPDASWWLELEALDDGRLLAALRERRGDALAFDGHAELAAAPELTRISSPPSLTGAVALTLRDERAGALRLFAQVGPSGAVPAHRTSACESKPSPRAPAPTVQPTPRGPSRTDVVVVADPGCGGAASGCGDGAASGCGGGGASDGASGCSGDDAGDAASGCSGDGAASGCSGDGAGGCADDAGGCAGDAVSARGARQAATRTAATFWPIALVGLVNRRWRRARGAVSGPGAPPRSP